METLERPSVPSGERRRDGRALRAPVLEVFASIQGEGLHVGEPQAFLRLRGCPLRCAWCDTPGSWALPAAGQDADGAPRARVAAAPEHGGIRREPTWATPLETAAWIAAVDPGGRRALSVTGGEPLVWPDFLLALAPLVRPRALHLETAGAHPAALERVLPAFAHVSLDLKLAADLAPPVPLALPAPAEAEPLPDDEASWARARRRALALVAGLGGQEGRDACGKLVVAGGRAAGEYAPLLDDVARLAPGLPLVLQPVTPFGGVAAPGAALLAELCELAWERGLAVRVVPQVHRLLGMP